MCDAREQQPLKVGPLDTAGGGQLSLLAQLRELLRRRRADVALVRRWAEHAPSRQPEPRRQQRIAVYRYCNS